MRYCYCNKLKIVSIQPVENDENSEVSPNFLEQTQCETSDGGDHCSDAGNIFVPKTDVFFYKLFMSWFLFYCENFTAGLSGVADGENPMQAEVSRVNNVEYE